MNNITLITCSYNTPDVTANMLKSFIVLHPECPILISENSTNSETENILKRANIPFICNKHGLHGPSVDLLLNEIKTKYALLVDTDIIFLKNHDSLLKRFSELDLTIMGDIEGDRGGKKIHRRVHPWHCFINVENVKKHSIRFYDKERMLKKEDIIYDIGSSFLEDIRKLKLKIADFKGNGSYYKHYEGMSWRVNKFNRTNKGGDIDNVNGATHDDVNLFLFGQHINKIYLEETKVFTNKELKYEYTKN